MISKSKNRNQKSIVLPMVIITTLIFLLMLSGWRLAEIEFKDIMPIENVEIEGVYENISLTDIREKVVSVLDGGYFSADISAIRFSLLELPWVEDASIRRQWPAGLHIYVVEKKAIAYWGNDAFLSDRGDVFSPPEITHNKILPKLNGPSGLQEKVWEFLVKIDSDLSETGLRVKQLTLDERRAWNMLIVNNESDESMVKLGREDTAHRLHRFIQVFSNGFSMNLKNVAVIDMRYPNGFAMKKKHAENESSRINKTELVQRYKTT